MAEKQYVPKSNGRSRKTQYGEFITIGFDVKELIAFAEKHKNERGYLNLVIAPRKTPNEQATHSIYLDDWKPGNRSNQQDSPARFDNPPPRATQAEPDNSGPPF